MSPVPERPPNSFIRLLQRPNCTCISRALSNPLPCSNSNVVTDSPVHSPKSKTLSLSRLQWLSDDLKAVTEHLRTPEDYELITYRLMQQLKEDNIPHAEVYVSVGVCLWRNQIRGYLRRPERGRQRAERDFGISVLWIFDAVRHFGAEAAQRYLSSPSATATAT